MARGRIARFSELHGYGFIAPEDGDEDVFVHANDLSEQDRARVSRGALVEFEAVRAERGRKALTVKVLEDAPTSAGGRSNRLDAPARTVDDDLCDVLSLAEFTAELTEQLVTELPELTGAQIMQLRGCLARLARKHGWLDG